MKHILFIGHDASRSGAPFVLLHLLRWLKRSVPECQFELLLLTGGELESEFRAVCDVHILRAYVGGTGMNVFPSKAARTLRKKLGLEKWLLSQLAHRFDLVLGNTAVSLEYLDFFKQSGCSTLCWMHEMDYALDLFYDREKFHDLASRTDEIIVGSNAVREVLLRRKIDRPINVVYEFLDTEAAASVAQFDVRGQLGIPADAFVLGACGTIEWRKGVDLFVQIARLVVTQCSNAYCLWVGGRYPNTEAILDQSRYDVRKLRLEGHVIFADPKHALPEYHNAMDVFLLPSREDTFPLVCLEAALHERPIVCFQNAGGMPEFVEDDCGFAVPYLDTVAAAERIVELARDRQLRRMMGASAAAKVRARYDVSNGGLAMLNIIKSVTE